MQLEELIKKYEGIDLGDGEYVFATIKQAQAFRDHAEQNPNVERAAQMGDTVHLKVRLG